MNRITFILLSLLLAWRIECQGMLLQPLSSGEGLVGFNPSADLYVLINVPGENTSTANRLAVADENFDHNEGVEEVV